MESILIIAMVFVSTIYIVYETNQAKKYVAFHIDKTIKDIYNLQ